MLIIDLCYFKSMKSKNIVFVGLVAAILLTVTVEMRSSNAAPITLDIKRAANPGPGLGDEKIGTVSIDASTNNTAVSSQLTIEPKQDKQFEGWLVDSEGSNYKLSLGKYSGKNLEFSQSVVNPFTYKQFIITEEPLDDKDPNAADTYGGTDLPAPFGQ
ncbi:MAG: hypothetical protein M3162_07280 [Thermoproteota archaeon]|nr:hypothetical protein [Thermoproteota archaeon]